MLVQLLGVRRMAGNKDGRTYDFAKVIVMQSMEQVSRENFRVTAYGYEAAEYDLDEKVVQQFAGLSFPCKVELAYKAVPRNIKGQQVMAVVITGLVGTAKA